MAAEAAVEFAARVVVMAALVAQVGGAALEARVAREGLVVGKVMAASVAKTVAEEAEAMAEEAPSHRTAIERLGSVRHHLPPRSTHARSSTARRLPRCPKRHSRIEGRHPRHR